MTAYRPSPRPTFDGPAAIPYASVTRHIWGDPEAGEVADWIYASTERVHALVFGLAPGAWFRHSPEFRTIFGADELLYVLRGTMVIANPETGEVLRVPRGGSAFFRADTWHHVHAHGNEELRVLELYAPPPATGSSGAYARTQAVSRAGGLALRRRLAAREAAGRRARAAHAVRARHRLAALARRARGPLREHRASHRGRARAEPRREHRSRTPTAATRSSTRSRACCTCAPSAPTATASSSCNPDDAAYIPQGVAHEYRSYGSAPVRALFGVAPSYLP